MIRGDRLWRLFDQLEQLTWRLEGFGAATFEDLLRRYRSPTSRRCLASRDRCAASLAEIVAHRANQFADYAEQLRGYIDTLDTIRDEQAGAAAA